jgi:hypothetical protein
MTSLLFRHLESQVTGAPVRILDLTARFEDDTPFLVAPHAAVLSAAISVVMFKMLMTTAADLTGGRFGAQIAVVFQEGALGTGRSSASHAGPF